MNDSKAKKNIGKQLVVGLRRRWGGGWHMLGETIQEALVHKAVLGSVFASVNPVAPSDVREVLAGALEEMEARG